MRSTLVLLVAAVFIGSAAAGANHNSKPRTHLRQKRAWGQRRQLNNPDPATFLSAVPSDATAAVTILNTGAAPSGTTAAAAGATQAAVAPLVCAPSAGLGGFCDPNAGVCCQTGLTCSDNACQAVCTIDTTEAYCDASTPCNAALGYTCYKSRCRPPTGAVRVQNGQSCDQGGANTQFCIPGKGICVGGTCLACSQHA
ncbi:hypothetical protein RTBOTA2_002192 [Rhodotorula toruloides]|uniref:Proteophosphoglycan 5 n=1 Tax=Rhodotorula toruloides TaxID=5286 RepID=A0A0K3CAQ8_RHOTO|nr:hypothetical protein RTBOTA2_002192 [Rhodotorula toruloides]PRQ77398.1 hypothetical protein AAT19DRAFT_8466 [Rhodotorula toruloides]